VPGRCEKWRRPVGRELSVKSNATVWKARQEGLDTKNLTLFPQTGIGTAAGFVVPADIRIGINA
jgi:hypothetical protein